MFRMKKTLWIGVPVLVLVLLVGWRYTTKGAAEAELAGQQTARQGSAPAVETANAGPRTIVQGIDALGTAEAAQRAALSPKVSGRIEFLQAREGDAVRAGQALVRIDPSEIQAQVLQQEANVAQTQARLAQAQLTESPTEVGVQGLLRQQNAGLTSALADYDQTRANLESQVASADALVAQAGARLRSAQALAGNAQSVLKREQASLANAQTRLTRTESLYKQGFIAAQEVDDARTAVEVQRKTVEVSKGQLQSATSSVAGAQSDLNVATNSASIVRRKGTSDIAAAKAKVDQASAGVDVASANRAQSPAYRQNLAALRASVNAAQAQLRQARAQLSQTLLVSPVDGVVTMRNGDPGSMASPSQPVLVVETVDSLIVVASLPLEHSDKVRVGQAVEIAFDAMPGRMVEGVVANINPSADLQSRQFGIRIRVPNPDRVIKSGMYGRATIVDRKVAAGVAVPREAVRKSPSGGSVVTVIDAENVAHDRSIQVGIADTSHVEILGGLKAGEKVVTLAYRPVRDGQKVVTESDRPPDRGAPGQPGGRRDGQPGGRGAGQPGGRP